MRAGKLRHRVEVLQPATAQDSFGEVTPGWKLVGRRWAEVTPITGTDKLVRDQYRQAATHRVRLRFMEGLTVRHLIRHGGRDLHILSLVNVDEQDAEMLLDCEERVGT